MAGTLYLCVTAAVGLAVLGSVGYMLAILAAAVRRPLPVASAVNEKPKRVVVLVPAHNEELVIAASLDSILRQDYPAQCMGVIVIADNCTDSTAAIARTQGATVWERNNTSERGKGYALDWAISLLLARPQPADIFVILDADTKAAPDFLRTILTRLLATTDARGMGAVQGRYGVLNASESWRSALMAAAFDLVNHIRPLGRDRLGLSVGLKGNGMAFTRETLARVRWQGASLTEDLDFALDLARDYSVRVAYAPEARVWAQMPTGEAQAVSQRQRWERGRAHSLRSRALPLLWQGLKRRNILLIDSALDLLVPPLAELAALTTFWLGLIILGLVTHLLTHPALWVLCGAVAIEGYFTYVLGGLRAAGASKAAYIALLRAPGYALWKIALRLKKTCPGINAPEWVRTERAPISIPADEVLAP